MQVVNVSLVGLVSTYCLWLPLSDGPRSEKFAETFEEFVKFFCWVAVLD